MPNQTAPAHAERSHADEIFDTQTEARVGHVAELRHRSGLRLTAGALKVTAVLDPTALLSISVPPGTAHVDFTIDVGGRKVVGRFNAKTLRRAVATVNEHGADRWSRWFKGG